MAESMDVPFLGRVPIYEPIRVGGDTGVPIVIGDPESPAARALTDVASRAAAQVSIASYQTKPASPLVPAQP
jgi:ATP-binding protein involved in chromosome partitioning